MVVTVFVVLFGNVSITVFVVDKVAGVVVETGKLTKLLFGQQDMPPKDLNTPPVAFVETTVEYLVLVLIPQAVICEQSHLTNGYTVVVTPPIEKATGIFIVAVEGIV